MKILIISHEYPPVGGGGANACLHLAYEYSKAGHKVDIVTIWFPGREEVEKIGNITIYREKAKRRYKDHCSFSEMLSFVMKAKVAASDLERQNQYDICQIFFGIPSGPIGYCLKRKYGLPYVIRFGGGDIPGFQDRFAFIYKLIAPFLKIIWKNASALVANSEGLKLIAQKFCDKYEISIIHNGAKIVERQDEKRSDKRNIVRLLCVSRLIKRKGIQDFLPYLKEVVDICKKHNKEVVFDIVGDGPYRENLEKIVREKSLKDIVVFRGQKNKNELSEDYSNADIFLFPSRKEGMPNAVLEAMSYGLPIVMTPCQGSEELINGNGIICTVNYFAEAITEIILDFEKQKAMGEKSRSLVHNNFSWSMSAKKYLDLFEKYRK